MHKEEYEVGSARKNAPSRPPGPGPGPGGGGGAPAKNFKATIKNLLNYSSHYKGFLFTAIIFSAIASMFTLSGPDMLSTLTDEISAGIEASFLGTGGINLDVIYRIVAILSALYIGSYLLSIAQGVMLATVMQKTAKSLRSDIFVKINKLPMGYFSKNSKGDVLSRVTNDVDTIGQSLSQSVGTLISAFTLLIGSIIMMLLTNVILTVTALLSTAIGFISTVVVLKMSQKHFKGQQKFLGGLNGHIEEMYAGHTVIKAYNGEERAIQTFNELNANLKDSAFKAQALSGLMMPTMTFIGNFGYVCVCIVGAMLAIDGHISFGVIVAFMIYIRLFTQPLGQIAQGMQNLQMGVASAERVFDFLDEEEMPDESGKSTRLENVKGNVEFKHVKFGYNPKKIIINDFSASASSGQKIAIVGPTGAGKTTLVNLLMRFYDMNGGDILIDGVSINDVPREDVQSNFSMVLQDTWIFEGTLRENLVYATPDASDEMVIRATKAVGLHHFATTLEKGYDTILDDKLELSQGQKQQITIARAMLADKPMLILDEATSSIDTRTELQIQKSMDELMDNRTSFVIAHRLSTIKNADLILVMKDGDVIETGSHDELLAQKGFYEDLYNSQFDNN